MEEKGIVSNGDDDLKFVFVIVVCLMFEKYILVI